MRRHAGDGSNGDRMIAAEDQRHRAGGCGLLDQVGKPSTGVRDLLQVTRAFLTNGGGLGLIDRDVPQVLHFVTQRGESSVQIG